MNRSFEEIFQRYTKAKNEKKLIFLSQPSTGNIRNRLIELVNSNEISEEDMNHLETYLPKNTNNKTLVVHLSKIDELYFRPISYFLYGKTKNPDAHSIRPVLDMLIDFDIKKTNTNTQPENEPIAKEKEDAQQPIHIKIENTIKFKNTLGILGLVAISSFFYYLAIKEKEACGYWKDDRYNIVPCDTQMTGIKIETLNIENINIDTFRKIIPDQNTQFFSDDGTPQLWYASYNGDVDFFNASGKHPVSGEKLKPISKKVIKTYILDKQDSYSESNDESVISLEKAKSEIVKNSLAIYIFDSTNKMDTYFSNNLNIELSSKRTIISPSILLSDSYYEIIEDIKMGNINELDKISNSKTEFVCVGSVHYSFTQNKLQPNFRKCTLSIRYKIINTQSNEVKETYNNTISGIGITDNMARANTIKKFKL